MSLSGSERRDASHVTLRTAGWHVLPRQSPHQPRGRPTGAPRPARLGVSLAVPRRGGAVLGPLDESEGGAEAPEPFMPRPAGMAHAVDIHGRAVRRRWRLPLALVRQALGLEGDVSVRVLRDPVLHEADDGAGHCSAPWSSRRCVRRTTFASDAFEWSPTDRALVRVTAMPRHSRQFPTGSGSCSGSVRFTGPDIVVCRALIPCDLPGCLSRDEHRPRAGQGDASCPLSTELTHGRRRTTRRASLSPPRRRGRPPRIWRTPRRASARPSGHGTPSRPWTSPPWPSGHRRS